MSDVAVDGVDEILAAKVPRTFSWGTFVPGPESARLALAGPAEERAPRDWTMVLGRFTGAGPESRTAWDLDAAELTGAGEVPEAGPTASVTAPAWDLDLWLWGRGPTPPRVSGDAGVLKRFRAIVVESTR